MDDKIPYLEDITLETLKENFFIDLIKAYKDLGPIEGVIKKIEESISVSGGIKKSDISFEYTPLLIGANEEDENKNAAQNAKILHNSLRHLTLSQAAMEKIWVALINTYYIEYHISVIRRLQGEKDVDQKIWDRTFITGPKHGVKRRLLMNNLSLLWWMAHYFYDDKNKVNPYHLLEFFMQTDYRGNVIAFFSSKIHSNKNITLGIMDGIKQLVDENVIAINRYAYSNSSKIVNMVGGVKLVDLMKREEIKELIVSELPKTDSIKLL